MGALYATDRSPAAPRPGLLALEGTGLVFALGYLAVANPHDSRALMPHCPIKWATGWDCPSCGGLRMAHDLLRGEVGQALADNPFLFLVSPVLVYLIYRHARALRTGQPYEVPKGLGWALLLAASAWGIVRNLSGFSWRGQPR